MHNDRASQAILQEFGALRFIAADMRDDYASVNKLIDLIMIEP